MKITDEIREAFLTYLDTVERINSKNIKYEKTFKEIQCLVKNIPVLDITANDNASIYHITISKIEQKIEEVLNEKR